MAASRIAWQRFLFGPVLAAATLAGSAPAQNAAPVAITVDLSHPLGPASPLYSWFGYDEANYTTAPDGRHLLRELHDLSPVPVSIRFHHVLTSGDGTPDLKWSSTGIYHEDAAGRPVYDFHLLDAIFDSLRDAGVRPMVELGFMPEDLAAALPGKPGQPYQVRFPQSTISGRSNNPPRDYSKWGELCRVLTAHLVERYGRSTVAGWYFEVWNEPDIDYWHGTPEDYWRLYDFAAAGVRSALPGALVGGPASTSPGSAKAATFLRNFLEHVRSGRSAATGGPVPLSFITFHAKGQPTLAGGNVTMGLNRELTDVDQGFRIVSSFPAFRHLPIVLSEADPEGCAACSSKQNPANNYRNGTLYPAYTAAAYSRLFELARQHDVHLAGMLSWSFEFEGRDYFEGFRSLSTNGVDKPILNLFRMLALLDGTRVRTTSNGAVPLETVLHTGVRAAPDVDALGTAGDRRASILLWNYHDDAASAPDSPVALTIRGLPTAVRRVLLTPFRIDQTHSNAYTVWQGMGSPQHPTPDQLISLHAREGLELLTSPTWVDAHDGSLTLPSSLPRESVSLLQLTW